MDNVLEKNFWAKETGLLPIRLSPTSDRDRFILLDGGFCDFCLDLSGEERSITNYYSDAWSSDVKNYITIDADKVFVYNWNRQTKESVKLSIVHDKFHSFLKILNSTNYRTADDITPFILRLFAQIRNLTRERIEPNVSLNLLFKLLISLKEDCLTSEICSQWGIENVYEPAGFDVLQELIRKGVRNITPNLDYILRHGSGPLFETAHREASCFDTQLDLFGEISSNLEYFSQAKYTGIHYTPRYLVRSIVENTIKYLDLTAPTLTILDPACGSGTFLQEALKQLRENNYQGRISIKGFDTSSVAVQTTKFLLGYETRALWGKSVQIDIRQQDSLLEEWGENDLVLMNPPFISSELIKDTNTKEIINMILTDVSMKKRPNMAAAFLYKAMKSLTSTGVLGAVLPSSILLQEQYLPLRNMARQIMKLTTVAQLGNFVFNDALVDTTFIIGQKNKAFSQIPLTIWCSNREQSAFDAMKGWRKMQYNKSQECIKDVYNIYTPSHFPLVRDSWKVLPKTDDELVQRVCARVNNGTLKPIQTVFEVRQGVIKGNRNVFEIDEREYNNLPKMEKRFYRPIASSQTIDYGSIKKGYYIWYPYSKSGLLIKNEEELMKYEWSYSWLIPHKENLLSRKGVNNWWELTRPRTELFTISEKILCSKRSGGAHSFAIASEDFIVEEGNVFLFKNNKYCEEDKYFYLSFFSSSIFQRLLSIYARPLKAGFDMGKVQIKDIPIIDVNENGIRGTLEYSKLVTLGKEYAAGYRALRELFDQYVLPLYK